MDCTRKQVASYAGFRVLLYLLTCWIGSPVVSHAQAPSARCPSSTGCLGQNAIVLSYSPPTLTTMSSAAYVDAAPFVGTGDICSAINTILNDYNSTASNGVVIDARGINPGTSQPCGKPSSPINPWNVSNVPSNVVLLPVGTITTYTTWVLPASTTLVGAGKDITIVKGAGSISGAVVQMGIAGAVSFGVAVSDLTIDTSKTVDGIDNFSAEELGYVKRVAMINVSAGKTGLMLGSSGPGTSTPRSSHSGPYADLSISLTGTNLSTSCINILSAAPRGIHGITCTNSGGTTLTAGIYLDGYNVSIEDAYISGSFTNGIYVGSQSSSGSVYSNALFNVQSNGPTYAVHLYYAGTGVPSVSDTTIMGVTRSSGSATIRDDLPGSASGGTLLTDTSVGLYVVGETIPKSSPYIGSSRFNTSTGSGSNVFPAWIVGGGLAPISCSSTGSLYSRIANSSGNTLWGCAGGKWRPIN